MTSVERAELAVILGEVRRIELRMRRLVNDHLTGGYNSAFRGAGMEFDEVREYVEGDEPRSIDWNVTARTGSPHVKKYVEEREQTVLFVLDLSPSMDAGFGRWSIRQAAVRVCAILGMAAQAVGDRVGLVAFDEGVVRYLPAQKGTPHLLRILREGLVLRSTSARSSPEAALERIARVVKRRAVVFLVSDFLMEDGGDALGRCARRHDVVAVRMRAPETFRAPAGSWRLVDPETGRRARVDWDREDARARFSASVEGWEATWEARLRHAGIDAVDVAIEIEGGAETLARPIDAFFRMRAHRRAAR